MSLEETNVTIVRAYIAAIEAFDIDRVGELLHPDVVQTEYPNKLYATGQVRNREVMLRDLPRGKAVLRSQTYPINSIIADGDCIVVETRWEGVLNVALGRLNPGDSMVAHICMVFTLRDGRIVAQRNYDCYEDFSAAA